MTRLLLPVVVAAIVGAGIVSLMPTCAPGPPSSASLRAFDAEPCRGSTLQYFGGLEERH